MRRQQSAIWLFGLGMLALTAAACTLGPLESIDGAQATLDAADDELSDIATRIAPTLQAVGEQAGAAATQLAPTLSAAEQQAQAFLTQAAATVEALADGVSEDAVSQWAAEATALSQYAEGGRSAQQATGAPDTPTCGDAQTAWASREHDEVTALILSYAQSVIPEQIHIYETFNPGAVTSVEVVAESGQSYTVYQASPQPLDNCPYVRVIAIDGIDMPVSQVVINVDQSDHPGRNQIDAVALVGVP